MYSPSFRLLDRGDGGVQLSEKLLEYKDCPSDTIVLGISFGGIITASSVATELGLPLDVLYISKIEMEEDLLSRSQPLVFGAVSESGCHSLDQEICSSVGITHAKLQEIIESNKQKSIKYGNHFRGNNKLHLANKRVIIVDDGIETKYSIDAAIQTARGMKCKNVIVASPVIDPEITRFLNKAADGVAFIHSPQNFKTTKQYYARFGNVSEHQVSNLLKQNHRHSIPSIDAI